MNPFKSMMAATLVSVFSLSGPSFASTDTDIQSLCDEEFAYSGLQPEEKTDFMENCSIKYGFNASYEEDDYTDTGSYDEPMEQEESESGDQAY